jgi:cell fate regulator YaaT (PSP1 superfamily)
MTEIEIKPHDVADPYTRRIGVLVGVVGVLLSVVTISSHRSHTHAVMHRTESNDQWTYYQAKKIRESGAEMALTVLQATLTDPARLEGPAHKLQAARDHYASDATDIQKKAQTLDDETALDESRALRFDIGEGLLELGLVLCSLYFLAHKSFFPVLGVIAALAGTVLGIWGFVL